MAWLNLCEDDTASPIFIYKATLSSSNDLMTLLNRVRRARYRQHVQGCAERQAGAAAGSLQACDHIKVWDANHQMHAAIPPACILQWQHLSTQLWQLPQPQLTLPTFLPSRQCNVHSLMTCMGMLFAWETAMNSFAPLRFNWPSSEKSRAIRSLYMVLVLLKIVGEMTTSCRQ